MEEEGILKCDCGEELENVYVPEIPIVVKQCFDCGKLFDLDKTKTLVDAKGKPIHRIDQLI